MACRVAHPSSGTQVPGVEIERASNVRTLAEFAPINADNWVPPDLLVESYYARAAGRLLAARSPLRFYVARRRGEPVALAASALGILNLATRREHRGRGIASVGRITEFKPSP